MAIVFVWNPQVYIFRDLPRLIENLRMGRPAVFSWSVGSAANIQPGERFWLFRRRVAPEGIIASGSVVGDSFESDHFSEKSRHNNKRATYVNIQFDAFIDPAIDVPLDSQTLSGYVGSHWLNPISGWRCDDVEEGAVIELWQIHLNNCNGAVWTDDTFDDIHGDSKIE